MNDARATAPARRRTLWLALLLVLAAVLPYARVLDAPFVYDDQVYVVDNGLVRAPGLEVFTESYPPGRAQQGLYRPLTVLSYALDHALFGMRSAWFHRTNVLLHALATLAVWLLLARWQPRLGFAAALVFAVHPAHVEAVAWVVGRAEVLCGLLACAALALSSARLGAACALLFAALLSKEMALAAPALALLPLLSEKASGAPVRRAALAFAGVVLVYLVLRAVALGGLTPSGAGQVALAGATPLTRVCAFLLSFGEYVRLAFFPAHLEVDYAWSGVPGPTTPGVLLGLALLASGLALSALLRRRVPWFGVGFLWLVLALFPVSHLIPFGTTYAERLLYLPSVGACLLVAGAAGAVRPRALGVGALALVLALGVGRTWTRSAVWADEERFYRTAVADHPANPAALLNLGTWLAQEGRVAEATDFFERALAHDPRSAPALTNLAIVRAGEGRGREAEALLARALEADPTYARAWFTLGNLHASAGRRAAAIEAWERALQVDPSYRDARNNLNVLRGGS